MPGAVFGTWLYETAYNLGGPSSAAENNHRSYRRPLCELKLVLFLEFCPSVVIIILDRANLYARTSLF